MRVKRLLRYAERLAMGIALEVSAYPKPGNVHRLRNFADTVYEDFLVTAIVAVEPLYRGIARGYRYRDTLGKLGVVYGDIVYDMVSVSMRASGGGNTCLGISIMLTPISIALGYELALHRGIAIERVLETSCRNLERYSKPMDAVYFYRAVRVAAPSYVRKSDETGGYPNVWDRDFKAKLLERGVRLWEILRYSSSFDIVARDVVECYPRARRLSDYISRRLEVHGVWNRAVVEAYLYQLSRELDTLVVRKNGVAEAELVKGIAGDVLDECERSWQSCLDRLNDFDRYLASRGVNPGSTADIVATAISIYVLAKEDGVLRP